MKVINIGSLNIDHIYRIDRFLLPGETKSAASYTVNAGGKGLNQSIALAKAGATVYHGGVVGADGGILLDVLRDAGVHLEFLQQLQETCGHAIIQVDDAGQNCILLHGGTNQQLTRPYIDCLLQHCTSEDILLLQNETNFVDYIIEQAAQRNIRIAFNAAPMQAAVQQYPLDRLSWLIVNEVEGAQLVGGNSFEETMRRLRKAYPNTAIVLTLGAAGVWYCDATQEYRLGACSIPRIVDTTAAGDTFLGYFLAGMLSNSSVHEALTRATVASALAIGHPGAAISIPLASDVEHALRSPQYAL